MITRKQKLISAAMLIALFVLARSAGATVITNYTDFTIFAEGDLTVGVTSGTGVGVGGSIGAIGDVTIGDNVQVSDVGDTWGGSVFANNSVIVGDYSYIMGRVLADNLATGGGVVIGAYSGVDGRVDAGAEAGEGDIDIGDWSRTEGSLYSAGDVTIGADVDIGSSGNPQSVHGAKVTIGRRTEVWGMVQHSGALVSKAEGIWGGTGNTPTPPEDFTYTTRTAPTFTVGAVDKDITTDAELAPGTYNDLIVRSGVTLTVYHDGATGTYDFRNITLESGANISIRSDTGASQVILNAMEDLATSGSNVLGRVGQASLTMNIGNQVTIGSGSTVWASLLAYSDTATSTITINANSTILGKVYSKGNVIIYDNVLVPEPGTLVLLGLGAACLLVKRRRGNRA